MSEINHNQKVLGWLIVARTGHGHFTDYHNRFRHEEPEVYCRYGQRQSQFIPFSYIYARLHGTKLFSLTEKRPLIPNEILGTAKKIKLFAERALKTELFRRNRGLGKSAGL